METEWVMSRMELYQQLRAHPDWTNQQLAEELGRSLSWVKKWKQRFRQVAQVTWQMFLRQAAARQAQAQQVSAYGRQVVLNIHEQLSATYQRRVGPERIQAELRDPQLQAGGRLPRSTHTIWKILKEAGRIPTRLRPAHYPLERPDPLAEWEFDFTEADWIDAQGCEIFVVVDRGTSMLLNIQVDAHYNAETALNAVAHLLLLRGLPQRLRFDRDTRFVGSAFNDGYPSALIKFLRCLGIQPVVCAPRRPDLKPFVERCNRTLKEECLNSTLPADRFAAEDHLTAFGYFYNLERPNQALSCGNQPPATAFPVLPPLPALPDEVDPDAWLKAYHKRLFKRHVAANGSLMIDKYTYYLGREWAGQRVACQLDADAQVFRFQIQGQIVKTLPISGLHGARLPFQAYLKLMLEEARSLDRLLQAKQPYYTAF